MGKGRTRAYRSWDRGEPGEQLNVEEYDGEEQYEQPRRRRKRRPRRKRSVWPALLTGCGLGVVLVVLAAGLVVFFAIHSAQNLGPTGGIGGIGNTSTFTQNATQTLAVSSALAQLQVCDKIGNVTITADPTASVITLASEKVVHATNQTSAAQEFGRIAVNVQPISATATAPTCEAATGTAPTTPPQSTTDTANALVVTTTLPDSTGLFRGTNDAINLTLTVPALNKANSTFLLNVNAPLGDISVTGVSGNLQIKGSSGNITVSQGVLAVGSHIETGQGNVTFSGALALPTQATGATARYLLQCEQGNIDVTLPPGTSVTLDANTNVGSISSSDFQLAVKNVSGGGMSYHGPLTTSSATPPSSLLILDVSTGNVILHQATA